MDFKPFGITLSTQLKARVACFSWRRWGSWPLAWKPQIPSYKLLSVVSRFSTEKSRESVAYRGDLCGNTPNHILTLKESAPVNDSWECVALCESGVCLYVCVCVHVCWQYEWPSLCVWSTLEEHRPLSASWLIELWQPFTTQIVSPSACRKAAERRKGQEDGEESKP